MGADETPANNPLEVVNVLVDDAKTNIEAEDIMMNRRMGMSNFFRNNRTAFRSFILGLICNDVGIEDAYKSVCKALQDENLDYPMFEETYMRLSTGEHIDFELRDHSKDNTLESLPVEVFEKVCKNLSLPELYWLRLVSTSIRDAFKKSKFEKLDINVERFAMCVAPHVVIVNHDYLMTDYRRINDDSCKVLTLDSTKPGWTHGNERRFPQNFLDKSCDHAQHLLNNLKVKIDTFSVTCMGYLDPRNFFTLLRTSRTAAEAPLLHVKKLSIDETSNTQILEYVLPLLRPDIIQEICLKPDRGCVCNLGTLRALPQWISAVKFTQDDGIIPWDQIIHLLHFEEVFVQTIIPREELPNLIEAFERSQSMKKFTISFRDNADMRLLFIDIDHLEEYEPIMFEKDSAGHRFEVSVKRHSYTSTKLSPLPQ